MCWFSLAVAHSLARLGDVANARAAYDKCLSLEPNDPVTELNYAITLFNAGDEAGAASHLAAFDRLFGPDGSRAGGSRADGSGPDGSGAHHGQPGGAGPTEKGGEKGTDDDVQTQSRALRAALAS
jgi:hypothetical protein